MKKRNSLTKDSANIKQATSTIGFILLSCLSALAEDVLIYDSQYTNKTASNQNYLSLISNDSDLVAKPATTTSMGWNTTFIAYNTLGRTNTVNYGSGHDAQWRFGSDAQTLNGTVEDAVHTGEWVGFNFIAAQDLIIDGFNFVLFINSVNRDNYAARDAGLFISVDGGEFIQFGSTHNSTTSNNKHGTVSFNDEFKALKGQNIKFRLAFTDRTVTSGGPQQEATRLGSFVLSAKPDNYVAIPEPNSYVLISGILALACIAMSRRMA